LVLLLDLAASAWRVESINQLDVIDSSKVTLVFNEDDLRFFGATGCKRYSGNFKLDQDSPLMTGVLSTRRACVSALMIQEQKFLATLPVIQKDDINANGLLILSGSDNKEQRRFIATLNE